MILRTFIVSKKQYKRLDNRRTDSPLFIAKVVEDLRNRDESFGRTT